MIVNWLLIVSHGRTVGLGRSMRVGVVAGMGWRRRAKGRAGAHLVAIVVIEARGTLAGPAVGTTQGTVLVLGGANEDTVVGVGLDMLLEILGPLERLAAEVTLMGLQRNVHADVRSDMVTLDSGGAA